MTHEIAEQNGAVERYLLDEFSSEERADFEAHYFECPDCADRVRCAAVFAANAKEVLRTGQPQVAPEKRRWWNFFPAMTFAPAFAALALATIAGYQNLVTMPKLEQPQVLSSDVIAPQTRDAAPVVPIDRSLPRFNVNFMVDAPQAYPEYVCEFKDAAGGSVLRVGSGARAGSSFTLSLLLPTKEFRDGRYDLSLSPKGQPETVVERYTFVIRSQTTP